jgi:DNA-binding winged helix-turn-helix (wHTH) protein
VDASSQSRRDVWRVGDLVIDEGQQLVTRGDEVIELPKLSFDLLLALVRSAPDVVSIDALLTRVWPGVVVSQETVVQRVKMLREALNDRAAEPRYIMALRLRGYRLVAAVSKTEAPTHSASRPGRAGTGGPAASTGSRGRAGSPPAESTPIRSLGSRRPGGDRSSRTLGPAARHRSKSPAPDTNDPALRTVAVLPFKNLSSNPRTRPSHWAFRTSFWTG